MSTTETTVTSEYPVSELPTLPFGLVPFNDELVIPTREFLVEGLWPKSAVGFIGGPPKAGKSWLTLDMAICLAAGIPFLGREVPSPKRVFYFLGEEYLGDVAERADRLLKGHSLLRSSLEGRLLITQQVPRLEIESQRHELVDLARAHKPDLFVLDPLERFLDTADTNSSSEMRVFTNFVRERLTRDCGAAVCVVHHTDKKGKSLRGTGDFRAVSEITMTFGEKSGDAVRIATEMRCGRAPEPFKLRLADALDGSVAWQVPSAEQEGLDLEAAARSLFQAGAALSSTEVRRVLKVRNERVTPLMEKVGARRDGSRGKWSIEQPLTLAA